MILKNNDPVIEVGIIGAGAITTTLHLPLLSVMDNIKLKYIADIFKPNEIAKLYNMDSHEIVDVENLPDCDLLLLTTPVGVREEYIKEFSSRKIPIFSEKPFALDLKSHENYLKNNSRMSCNYMKIWYNSSKLFEYIISSNIFGILKKISIIEGGIIGKTNRGTDTYQSNTRLSGGGVIMESSCHTLSVLADVFDDIIVKESSIVWQNDLDVEAKITFEATKKQTIPTEYLITLIKPVETKTLLFFENCIISFNHTIPNPNFIITDYKKTTKLQIRNDLKFAMSSQQAYYLKWKGFLEKISAGEDIDARVETSIKTTELISNIYNMDKKK